MPDETRDEGDAGWAAPDLPPSEPSQGAGATPPGDPAPAPPPAPSAPPPATPASPPPAAPAAPPAPGVPPPPPDAPAARKPRRTWLYLLIGLVAVGVLAAIAGTVLFVDRTVPPYDAAKSFLDDLGDGRRAQAAAQLCAADREDSEAALSEVTRTFIGGRTIFVNPLTVDRNGDRATVEYEIDVRGDEDGDSTTFDLAMREENGTWRACPLSG